MTDQPLEPSDVESDRHISRPLKQPRLEPTLATSAPIPPVSAAHQPLPRRVSTPSVSVIIAVYNSSETLDACFEGLLSQTYQRKHAACAVEISLYDDASTDDSLRICAQWKPRFLAQGFGWVCGTNGSGKNVGPGAARNAAVEQSSGEFLCIHDSDDVSDPERIELQLAAAMTRPMAIIGCAFDRIPEGSTEAYMRWHNALSAREMELQQYRELTLVQPTWFMRRSTFDAVGGYASKPGEEFAGPDDRHANAFGLCEDLKFFYRFLEVTEAAFAAGEIKERLYRVPKVLLTYRYGQGSMSKQTPRRVLLRLRVRAFERRVLSKWQKFSIWGAGRDGKQFFNELSEEAKEKVQEFCDIDEKKIARGYHNAQMRKTFSVVHFKQVKPPFVICVAKGRAGGELEANVESLRLTEGVDFFYFT